VQALIAEATLDPDTHGTSRLGYCYSTSTGGRRASGAVLRRAMRPMRRILDAGPIRAGATLHVRTKVFLNAVSYFA
jgi:hypothetical protein